MKIINKIRTLLSSKWKQHNESLYADEYLERLVTRLKACVNDYKKSCRILKEESEKGYLVNYEGVRFRRGEYNIHEMLTSHGHNYAEHLDIVTKLHLSLFPRLIETFDVGFYTYIITHIEGTTKTDLVQEYKYEGEISEQAYRDAVKDIKTLEKNGYYLLPTFRYCICVNNNGRIIIPEVPLISIEEADPQLVRDVFTRYGHLCPWNNYRWIIED